MTEPLLESAMHCPECGCQFCPNCFGAVCDCNTVFYRHDVGLCDAVRTAIVARETKRQREG